jgi:chromosomal replication initiator protein
MNESVQSVSRPQVEAVWVSCLQIIKANVPEQSFKTWFEPIVPLKLEGYTLTIQVPSQFFYEWLEDNFVHVLRRALDYAIGREGLLEYSIIVDTGGDRQPPIRVSFPTTKSPDIAEFKRQTPPDFRNQQQPRPKESSSAPVETYLNPNYLFDNYIEGDCNRLARSAGMAVAKRPGSTAFNPLLIYGGVGLGKTHLVQAIGNHIKGHLSKTVLYVSSEKFTNQFINSIKNNTLQDFTEFYTKIDALILDDVQFLSGKEKTQDTFFHIFNHLHQSGKQIIMTSDRRPSELQGLQDRLLSRFKWGLTADLQQPDFETRIAIIQRKLQEEGINIEYSVIEHIANSANTNIRELEGVIISLMAQSSLVRREIDIDLAKSVLKDIVMAEAREVNIDTIQAMVSDYFDISVADLKGKSRVKELVYPRQLAMYFAKELTDLSLKAIGNNFGGRDHSTVIHAVNSINETMVREDSVRDTIQKLRSNFV